MLLEAELSVAGPPQAVFDALVDVRRAVEAVPGARLTEAPPTTLGGPGGDRGVAAELCLHAGSSQITYRGRVLPEEADRSSGTLACSLDAREARGGGVLRGRLGLRLDPADEGTRLRVDARLEVTGRAESIGEERVREAALRLLHRVADRLGATVAAEAPTPVLGVAASSREAGTVTAATSAERAVPGEVRLVSREPVPLSSVPVSPGPLEDLVAELRRRPWLAGLLLGVAVAAVALLLRRLRRPAA